jgi:GNAT superfamily N-acetyltransferase
MPTEQWERLPIIDDGRAIGHVEGNVFLDADSLDVWLAQEGNFDDDPLDPSEFRYPIGYMKELVVAKSARRNGHGSRAVEEFKCWCKDKGCSEILLNAVEQEDGPTLAELVSFYKQCGFIERSSSGSGRYMYWSAQANLRHF